MPKQRSGQELVKTRRACEKLPLAGVRLGGGSGIARASKRKLSAGSLSLSEGEDIGRSGHIVSRAAGSSLRLSSGTAEPSRASDQRPHSFDGAASR